MEALVCEKIFLESQNSANSEQPQRGVVVVDPPKIRQVIKVQSTSEFPKAIRELQSLYPEITIRHLEDAYLLPGLIDINTKAKEGISETTHLALSGGVTSIFIETTESVTEEQLYCDLGKIKPVTNSLQVESSEYFAFKAYQCTQSEGIIPIEDMQQTFERCKELNCPLILDSLKAHSRFLHMASPFRTEEEELRSNSCEFYFLNSDYVAAVDRNQPELDSISSSESEEEINPEAIPCPAITEESSEVSSSFDFVALSQVVLESYSGAGETFYNVSATNSGISNSSTCANGLSRMNSLRPPRIDIGSNRNDETSYFSFLLNCPSSWELKGVNEALEVLERTNCKIHFANVSSVEAMNALQNVKSSLNLTFETCPHYIFFNEKEIPSGDTRFKTFPPIRDTKNQMLIQKLLNENSVDMINSHHKFVPENLKFLETGEFKRAMSGVNVLGFSLQAVWTQLYPNSKDPEKLLGKLVKLMSQNQAKFLGLQQKGGIAEGKDADLLIFKPFEVEDTQRSPTCIYNNTTLHGKVCEVYLRGRCAYSKEFLSPLGVELCKSCL